MDLSHIVEPLQRFAVPIEEVFEDSANPNTHDERSIRAIMGSFKRYKQRMPIVVNANTNIVGVGNGRLEAARRLGWTHIAAIFLPDDQLTHIGFAITDNRLSELSEMDAEALMRLMEEVKEQDPEAPVADLWDEVEWDELLAKLGDLDDEPPTLDELEDEYGDPDPEAFWPIVTVRIPPESFACYQSLMESAPGEDEAEKFAALLAAVDEEALCDSES